MEKVSVPQQTMPETKDGQSTVLKKEDVGPILIVWSSSANRQRLNDIRAKFKKALKKKWDGVIVHLRPGEAIGSLKLPQTEALYESLMRMFDPDLLEIRKAKRRAAEEVHRRAQQAEHELTAQGVADRLASIQREARAEEAAAVATATAKIEVAATAQDP